MNNKKRGRKELHGWFLIVKFHVEIWGVRGIFQIWDNFVLIYSPGNHKTHMFFTLADSSCQDLLSYSIINKYRVTLNPMF